MDSAVDYDNRRYIIIITAVRRTLEHNTHNIILFCHECSNEGLQISKCRKNNFDDHAAGFGGNFLCEKSRVSPHPAAALSHHDAVRMLHEQSEVCGRLADVIVVVGRGVGEKK